MNDELNDNSMIDTELQVRLMNLVMGEASDFERDQLQLLMEQRPELANYYQHLQHMHRLLVDVGQGDIASDANATQADDAWQLPVDIREKLLAVLDGRVTAEPKMVELAVTTSSKRQVRWSRRWTTAAVVAAASVLLTLTLFSFYQQQQWALARREFQAGTRAAALIDNSLSMERQKVELLSESLSQQMLARRTRLEPGVEPGVKTGVETGKLDVTASAGDNFDASKRAAAWPEGRGFGPADISLKGLMSGEDNFAYSAKPAAADDFGTFSQVGDATVARGDTSSTTSAGVPAQSTISVPDGGTILLGGIHRFSNGGQLERGWLADEPESQRKQGQAAPMTVTPRVQIAEEEDGILLGRNVVGNQAGEGRASIEQLQSRSDPVGTKEVEIRQTDLDGEPANVAIGGDTSNTTNMFSDVQTEFIEDLDLVIVKGAQRDVERTLEVIENIKGKKDAVPEGIAKTEAGIERDVAGVALPQSYEKSDVAPYVPVAQESELRDKIRALQQGKSKTSGFGGGGKQSANGMQGAGQQSAGQQSSTQSVAEHSGTANKDSERVLQELRERFRNGDFGGRGFGFGRNSPTPAPASKNKDQEIASLKESYDELMDQGRFAEAELVAKQVGKLLPDSQFAQLLNQNALMAKRDADYESTRSLKADNYTDFMSRIDRTFVVPQFDPSVAANDSKDGKDTQNHWKYAAPSPQVAANSSERFGVEHKPVEPKPAATLDEQDAASQAFSTFSLHVSDVSFKLAQATLAQGQWPEAAKIRIEEFVNALDYHDPLPTVQEKVACRIEQAIHPGLMQRNLLRVSMRTAASGRSQSTPLRLTIVLDNSGSMERPDRRQAVLQAVQMLVAQLRATDQVTLISFANTPRLLAEKVMGGQGAELLKLIENLPSEGGTNIEAALALAREKALEQKQAGAQNRIVMLTDGAVNLGNANPESLAKLVTELRDAGIAFDAAGISAADLNDEVLEALTRQGDGRYYLLDSSQTVTESFATQIAGALRPSAQNVKVQVEFNPQRVGRYKLLGFEKHRLNKEDFRNDKVDAAEMAAAEAGVAVYQYEIKPNGSGDIGSVSVRFRDLSTGQMVERRWPIPYDSNLPRLEQAEPTMQLAAIAALLAAKLSGGPLADSVDLAQLQNLVSKVSDQYASQPRVVQLRTMIEQAKAIGQ